MNNNCIKSTSTVYLIILIPLISLLIINNILIFAAEDKQQQKQNLTIASDAKDPSFFTFFENIKNATETPNIKAIVKESPIVKVNGTKSQVINPQNHTMSQDTQVLMMLDIPELKETLMDAKESLADVNIKEALTGIIDLENQFLLLQNKTNLTEDFQKIKEAISKTDFKKALDYITKIQIEVIKAETEVFKAQLMAKQDEEENGDAN